MGLVQSNPYKLEDKGNVWLLFYGFKAEYICGGFFGVIFLQCFVFSSQCTRSHVRGYTNRSVFIAHLHSSCGIFLFPVLKFVFASFS